MEVGSLFFALGFKSQGVTELNNFNSAVGESQKYVSAIQDTFNDMLFVLEKMAIKLNAVTKEEIDLNKTMRESQKIAELEKQVIEENNTATTKKISIIGRLHQGLVNLVGKSKAYRIEVIALSTAIVAFTKKAANAAIEIDKLSALTGIPTTKMQELGAMASQAGVNVEDLASAVRHFQENSIDIMRGQGNIAPYQFLGLDPHQNPLVLIDKLKAKMATLPQALKIKAAKDLGLSDDFIYLLLNAGNLRPPPKETLMTEEEISRLKDFGFYFNSVYDQVKRIMSRAAAFVEPFARQIIYGIDRISQMLNHGMILMKKYQSIITTTFKLLAIGALALAVTFSPVTVAITALLLILEDLYTFSTGKGRSVFGEMLKSIPKIFDYIKNMMSDFIETIMQTIADNITTMLNVPLKILSLFGVDTKGLQESITGGGTSVVKALSSGQRSLFNADPTSKEKMKTVFDASLTKDDLKEGLKQTVTFIINGADNPKAVANEVNSKLKQSTSDALYQKSYGGY